MRKGRTLYILFSNAEVNPNDPVLKNHNVVLFTIPTRCCAASLIIATDLYTNIRVVLFRLSFLHSCCSQSDWKRK